MTSRTLRPPNLADFMRARRLRPTPGRPDGYTRQELAARIPASLSYLTQLETGQRTGPQPEFLDAFARVLNLSRVEVRHLHNLAAAPIPGPRTRSPMSVSEMRDQITDTMLTAMHELDPHLCGYIDERWNVLACNDVYATAYPRLADVTNVLTWFFTVPESRYVMLEWEDEARLTVNWFRWHMARYQNPAWSLDLLDELSAIDTFVAMWHAEEVEFTRHQPLMHLRDPQSGEPYSVNVQITDVPATIPLQMFVGIKHPFSGPARLLATDSSL